MKKETLKEFGKGLIAFGNLVGGFSIINGMFGVVHNLPQPMIALCSYHGVCGRFNLYQQRS
jgi:hypothetical protein